MTAIRPQGATRTAHAGGAAGGLQPLIGQSVQSEHALDAVQLRKAPSETKSEKQETHGLRLPLDADDLVNELALYRRTVVAELQSVFADAHNDARRSLAGDEAAGERRVVVAGSSAACARHGLGRLTALVEELFFRPREPHAAGRKALAVASRNEGIRLLKHSGRGAGRKDKGDESGCSHRPHPTAALSHPQPARRGHYAAKIQPRRQPMSAPERSSASTVSCGMLSEASGTRMTGTPSTLARRAPGSCNKSWGIGFRPLLRGSRAGLEPVRDHFICCASPKMGAEHTQDPRAGESVTGVSHAA